MTISAERHTTLKLIPSFVLALFLLSGCGDAVQEPPTQPQNGTQGTTNELTPSPQQDDGTADTQIAPDEKSKSGKDQPKPKEPVTAKTDPQTSTDKPETKEKNFDQLMTDALEHLRTSEYAPSIKLLEQALKLRNDHPDALLRFALASQRHGVSLAQAGETDEAYALLARSGDAVHRLIKINGKPTKRSLQALFGQALYNEACAFCLADEPKKAMTSLEEAVEVGFTEVADIETDKDLEQLRKLPEYREFMEKLRERVTATKKPKVEDTTPEKDDSESNK